MKESELKDKDFLVQYDTEVKFLTEEELEKFIKVAVINNKDIRCLKITRI